MGHGYDFGLIQIDCKRALLKEELKKVPGGIGGDDSTSNPDQSRGDQSRNDASIDTRGGYQPNRGGRGGRGAINTGYQPGGHERGHYTRGANSRGFPRGAPRGNNNPRGAPRRGSTRGGNQQQGYQGSRGLNGEEPTTYGGYQRGGGQNHHNPRGGYQPGAGNRYGAGDRQLYNTGGQGQGPVQGGYNRNPDSTVYNKQPKDQAGRENVIQDNLYEPFGGAQKRGGAGRGRGRGRGGSENVQDYKYGGVNQRGGNHYAGAP